MPWLSPRMKSRTAMRLADSCGGGGSAEMILLRRSLYPADLPCWRVDCDSRDERAVMTSGEAMARSQIGWRGLPY